VEVVKNAIPRAKHPEDWEGGQDSNDWREPSVEKARWCREKSGDKRANNCHHNELERQKQVGSRAEEIAKRSPLKGELVDDRSHDG